MSALLVLGMVLLTTGLDARSSSEARLTGRVLLADGLTPRAGVTVALLDEADHTYRSAPTDDTGAFRIDTVPPGDYALVAHAAEGTFLAGDGLVLRSGSNPPLALTLNADAEDAAAGGGTKGGWLKGISWTKWVIAGPIGVAGLVAIADASDDVEEPASPF
jgi:hypothetical protein